jgi:hypothetical protein
MPPDARARIQADIAAILSAITAACEAARSLHAGVFAETPARPVLLSALAEGADRYAALAALDGGVTLAVALPFPVAEYEKDFAEHPSRDEYRRLITSAERVMVLPGRRDTSPSAYDSVGTVILENSDLILAVWDGGESGGKGGTTDLVERAAEAGMPVIHVDALGKQPPRILWSGLAAYPVGGLDVEYLPTADAFAAMTHVVDEVVRPPRDPDEQKRLARYLSESRHHYNWRLEMPAMLAMFGLRRIKRTDLEPLPPEALAADLETLTGPQDTSAASDAFANAYGFADAMAIRYAQVFRGSYVARFLLAATAVILGGITLIGGEILGWTTWPVSVAQMAIVGVVLLNTAIAARRNWHGRWRECREVAERMRSAVPSWLLGQVRNDAPGLEPAWTGWYSRAQLRALGLWSGELDSLRLAAVKGTLCRFVSDQLEYHRHTAMLMRAVEHRVDLFGRVFFVGALLLVALDIALEIAGIRLSQGWQAVLIGVTAGLPVFGTASFAIRAIGDFEGSAMRSARMAASLEGLAEGLAADPPDLVVLRARAAALADAMLGDVAHWRFATETRHLGALG